MIDMSNFRSFAKMILLLWPCSISMSATGIAQQQFTASSLAQGKLPALNTFESFMTCGALSSQMSDDAKADGQDGRYRDLTASRDFFLAKAELLSSEYQVVINVLPGFKNVIRAMDVNKRRSLIQYCDSQS